MPDRQTRVTVNHSMTESREPPKATCSKKLLEFIHSLHAILYYTAPISVLIEKKCFTFECITKIDTPGRCAMLTLQLLVPPGTYWFSHNVRLNSKVEKQSLVSKISDFCEDKMAFYQWTTQDLIFAY